MMLWEYLTLKAPVKGYFIRSIDGDALNEKLNELGREGWELSTGVALNRLWGESREVLLVLKRVREE